MVSQRRTPKLLRAGCIALLLTGVCRATDPAKDYRQMAATDAYLIPDSNAEIAMARSAAPEALSQHATVLVLTKTGYQTAINGTNGFTCLVERSWMSPFDDPGFWNPRIRGPICYNPPAVRTVLPYTLYRTKLFLQGSSREQAHRAITSAVSNKELPIPEAGAMSYMMSKAGYLGDSVGHWCPHLMFDVPKTNEAEWGSDSSGSPVLFNSDFRDVPEPQTVFMLAVPFWSDGTPSPHMSTH